MTCSHKSAFPAVLVLVLVLASCEDGCTGGTVQDPDGSTVEQGPLWTMVQPVAGVDSLNDVWGFSHDDLWAVGTSGTVLHFDGEEWVRQDVPTTEHLFAIHGQQGLSADRIDVYAVGANGTILHWDGTSWSLKPPIVDVRVSQADGPVMVTDALMGVWHGRHEGVYVVGQGGTILHKRQTMLEAEVFRVMQEELIQERMPVCENRLAYGGDGYPYAGAGGACQTCNLDALGMCSTSGSPAPVCDGPGEDLANDCELPLQMWSGESPQCRLGQRCTEDGEPMYRVTTFEADLKAVIGFGNGPDLVVLAVGESGTIMELRARSDTPQTSSTYADVTWDCVGFPGEADPEFCWRPVARAASGTPAIRDTLAGLWGTGVNSSFAVGEDGRMLRRHDNEWDRQAGADNGSLLRPATPVFLRDLWFLGESDMFVVGFSGVVMHRLGSDWIQEEVPTGAHLRGVWGTVRDDLDAGTRDLETSRLRTVIAVGSSGVILSRALR